MLRNKLTTIFALFVFLVSILFPIAKLYASGVNSIANQSVETVSPTDSTMPQNWNKGGWGTNTANLSYVSGGHNDQKSLSVQISSYTDGDAKWYFDPVQVTPGTSYTFSDYYKSDITSDLVIQYTTSSGVSSYQDLGNVNSAVNWTLKSSSFTVPAGISTLTVFHMISAVGTLQTDNFSLTTNTPTTGPTVSITSPAANSTLTGISNLSASASDSAGVKQVQFELDSTLIGSPLTANPYTYSLDTTKISNGSHTIRADALNNNGIAGNSALQTITVSNATPAGSNLISNSSAETTGTNTNTPLNWQNDSWGTNTPTFSYASTGAHSGTRSMVTQISSYTDGDAKWYFTPVAVTAGSTYLFSDYYQATIASDVVVAFTNSSNVTSYLDLGSVAASPSVWKQYSASLTVPSGVHNMTVYHLIAGVGSLRTDDYSLVQNNKPAVSISSPAMNSTITGTSSITATASDVSGIKNVQYQLDGINLGNPVISSPYSYIWNSKLNSNGIHNLTAIATNNNGQTVTSTAVSVTVNNQSPGSNILLNPSFETPNPTNANQPANWTSGSWGSNSVTFSYLNTGHSGTRSVKTQVTKFTNGSAYWYNDNLAVQAGHMYNYSDYYQSNVISEIDAAFNMSNGTVQYMYLGDPSPSANGWTKFQTQFTVPSGAVSVNFYHNLYSIGWLVTDDYNLNDFSYQGFSRPVISITADDGYASFYNNGLPLLKKYSFTSTDYIISGVINNDPNYMTSAMVKNLNSAGQEIGSHTVTHPDLTTLTLPQVDNELSSSQQFLQSLLGIPVKNFASPYGASNQQVVTEATKFYQSYRGVQPGYNAKNNFDVNNLMVQNMVSTTTLAEVQTWINQAKASNTWLILVYHQIDPNSSAGLYNNYPSDFDKQLSAIKSSGVVVENIAQALQELKPQL